MNDSGTKLWERTVWHYSICSYCLHIWRISIPKYDQARSEEEYMKMRDNFLEMSAITQASGDFLLSHSA